MNSKQRKSMALIGIGILVIIAIQLVGCATTEHTVSDIETKTGELKGTTSNGKILITEKHQLIVQEEKSVEDEIRIQDMVNTHFHDDLGYETSALTACRVSSADPAIGGSGEVTPLPKNISLVPTLDVDEQMGLNEDGDLKIVRRTYLDQHLAAMRKLQVTMEHMIDTVKPMREECERKLGYKFASTRKGR